jgi:hypothetical protein
MYWHLQPLCFVFEKVDGNLSYTPTIYILFTFVKNMIMQTIRLQVNNSIYKNLMWFLSRFKKDEINIIQENGDFLSIQEYLHHELESIDNGETGFINIDQLDLDLENTIRKYEN